MTDPLLLGRDGELRAIERLLDDAARGPAALAFVGEVGIGRTTLVRAASRRAHERGVRVLACSGAVAETELAYVGLADLLAGLEADRFAALPAAQREALDAALLRAHGPAPGPRRQAVAAAVRSLLERLAAERPIVLAIDDVQWLDQASARVVEHCARGLGSRVGLVVAWRADGAGGWTPALADWRHVAIRRLAPLDDAALGALLRRHAPPACGRRALARVAAAAGGNPLFALELLRALAPGEPPSGPLALSPPLRAVVAAWSADLDPDLERLLLAVACLREPALAPLTRAVGPHAPAVAARAAELGLLRLAGGRVRFAQPLLAEGILAHAGPAGRRAMHRRLAGAVADPEERARQLALGAVLPDALPTLAAAAGRARARGAPGAAAELLELALELDDAAALKARAAEHHLDAGDVERARTLLDDAIAQLPAGEERAGALVLKAELALRDAELAAARATLERARAEAAAGSPLQVAAGVRSAVVLAALGLHAQAGTAAEAALALAERLDPPAPGLVAQALGVAAAAAFAGGGGVQEARLERALALEDAALRTPAWLRPSLTVASVLGLAGRLDEATALLERLSAELRNRDDASGLAWATCALAALGCRRGDLAAAARAVDEAEQRFGTPPPAGGHLLTLTLRARIAAHAGRARDARAAAEQALALAAARDWQAAANWQHATLGLLELSERDPEAAAARLAPLAATALADGLPEPATGCGPVLGDAVEALVLIGRVQEAEPLVALLERRGAALGRDWALAVGARCRGLVLAASGDIEGAESSLLRALEIHDRLPLAPERARSLLTLGRIARRLRRRGAAARAFEQAAALFTASGAQLWVTQARDELAALGRREGPRRGPPNAQDGLTAAEARVARLAASGLTNRQVASTLQISPKTVDAHLGRVYRKLDIHSRAELGARMALRRRPSPR